MIKQKLVFPLVLTALTVAPFQANAEGLIRSGGVLSSVLSIDDGGIKLFERSIGGITGGRGFDSDNSLRERLSDIRGDRPNVLLGGLDIDLPGTSNGRQ